MKQSIEFLLMNTIRPLATKGIAITVSVIKPLATKGIAIAQPLIAKGIEYLKAFTLRALKGAINYLEGTDVNTQKQRQTHRKELILYAQRSLGDVNNEGFKTTAERLQDLYEAVVDRKEEEEASKEDSLVSLQREVERTGQQYQFATHARIYNASRVLGVDDYLAKSEAADYTFKSTGIWNLDLSQSFDFCDVYDQELTPEQRFDMVSRLESRVTYAERAYGIAQVQLADAIHRRHLNRRVANVYDAHALKETRARYEQTKRESDLANQSEEAGLEFCKAFVQRYIDEMILGGFEPKEIKLLLMKYLDANFEWAQVRTVLNSV